MLCKYVIGLRVITEFIIATHTVKLFFSYIRLGVKPFSAPHKELSIQLYEIEQQCAVNTSTMGTRSIFRSSDGWLGTISVNFDAMTVKHCDRAVEVVITTFVLYRRFFFFSELSC